MIRPLATGLGLALFLIGGCGPFGNGTLDIPDAAARDGAGADGDEAGENDDHDLEAACREELEACLDGDRPPEACEEHYHDCLEEAEGDHDDDWDDEWDDGWDDHEGLEAECREMAGWCLELGVDGELCRAVLEDCLDNCDGGDDEDPEGEDDGNHDDNGENPPDGA